MTMYFFILHVEIKRNNFSYKWLIKILSYIFNNGTNQLLDSNIDILNIIGGYVKKENIDSVEKEKERNIIDEKMKNLKNGYSNMLIKSKRNKKRLWYQR